LLAALVADCHSPVAALAVIEDDLVWMRAELFAEDGSAHVTGEIRGALHDGTLAERLAADLLQRAPEPVRRLFAA
jgi:hydroxymethylbilane synthase